MVEHILHRWSPRAYSDRDVPAEDLKKGFEAARWAATIAGYSPAAVQATKRLAMFSRRLSAAERAEIEAMRDLVERHDDYKEGAAAFSGRRA